MEQRETAQSHYYGFEKAEKEDSKKTERSHKSLHELNVQFSTIRSPQSDEESNGMPWLRQKAKHRKRAIATTQSNANCKQYCSVTILHTRL